MDFSILIVDDEEEICLSLAEILNLNGYLTYYLTNPSKIFDFLKNKNIDLVIMDVRMPEISGINLLKRLSDKDRAIPVIMISGFAETEDIVQAMRYGAVNFYTKPIKLDLILKEITNLARTIPRPSKPETPRPDESDIMLITENRIVGEIITSIKTIAPTDASVLITGESGTGKELAASLIHKFSTRCNNPLTKINCAAIPDALLESELFGYEQGAFTDAKALRKGKFELTSGGTIFLDEIADMSMNTQAKLLRFLEEKEFQRLGGSTTVKADVRVIAATNKDIEALIRKNEFRDDLFYRISVERIALPSLAKRKEDIMLLTKNFVGLFNKKYGKKVSGISWEVTELFARHDWPGNIRELKNCVERAVIFCQSGTIEICDLSTQYRHLPEKSPGCFGFDGEESSKHALLEALKVTGGNKAKAAELLNIHRNTLYQRMRKFRIPT